MSYKKGEVGQRPWGYWRVDEVGEGFIKKTIAVNPNASLSLQSHKHRSEKWKVVGGLAEATVNGVTRVLKSQETVEIPVNAIHRLKNAGNELLIIEETQFGEILDENDIVRYEDLYGRVSE
ncbi:MAG: phosphomannose isomerase type II C-terminal cupin domain [Holosporaceae bacterium]|nr:phosphomannose isomerase type II C-terminal cupin domain [Holosporaceae bacterium]